MQLIRKKYRLIALIILTVILVIPSINYLIRHNTVDGFAYYYTYTLQESNNNKVGTLSGILIIGVLLIFSAIYLSIINKEKVIFKNSKEILFFIIIISTLFTLILPYLSSDIYYYIGDSWLTSKYRLNPYYTTVQEIQNKGINDEILNNTGYWKNTVSVYGPLWNMISEFLVTFSFGNITIALFIFKISSLLVHVLNCYLILKITKSRKFLLLYGLNPLVLIEFLSNVHNDIYLILFSLFALYFFIRKKNNILTILFIALSISIKFSSILLVPFLLIYMYRNDNILNKIYHCVISGISIALIVIIMYLPYYRDIQIFTNMLVQGEKYSQSIMAFILTKNKIIFNYLDKLLIPLFIVTYTGTLIILFLKKDSNLNKLFKVYTCFMLVFIFFVLTTFQKWYILWLFPTIMWQNKLFRRFIIYTTIFALVPSINYFAVSNDSYNLGISYSLIILIMSLWTVVIENIFEKYKLKRGEKP